MGLHSPSPILTISLQSVADEFAIKGDAQVWQGMLAGVLQEGNLAKPKSCSLLFHPNFNSRSRKSFLLVMSYSITARPASRALQEQQDLPQFPSFSSAFTEGQQREEDGSQSAPFVW